MIKTLYSSLKPKVFIIGFLTTIITINVSAQTSDEVLSAKESDPIKLGWMHGFPPPQDKILSAADGSFFNFPAMRWSVVNMRQLMPTVEVSRGLKARISLFISWIKTSTISLFFLGMKRTE